MNQIPNIEETKLAGKVVICDGLYTGKVGTILGTGSSQYSIKLLVDGLERYEPDYALLHVTEDNEQAVKLLLTHNHQLQKALGEMLHKLHLCAIGKYEGDALENVKAQIKKFQDEL
jgi:hypothetical protein